MGKKRIEENSEALLWPLIDKENELRKEFRRRNPKFDQKKIRLEQLDDYLRDNWTVHKRWRNAVSVRKEKKIDERLENLWWVLLYKMGYTEMNSGRKFRIAFQRQGVHGQKQIDVYASARLTQTRVTSYASFSRHTNFAALVNLLLSKSNSSLNQSVNTFSISFLFLAFRRITDLGLLHPVKQVVGI